MTLAVAVLFGWGGAPAAAQESSDATVPFHTGWLVLGGAGTDVRPTSDRHVAFSPFSGVHCDGRAGRAFIRLTPGFAARSFRASVASLSSAHTSMTHLGCIP